MSRVLALSIVGVMSASSVWAQGGGMKLADLSVSNKAVVGGNLPAPVTNLTDVLRLIGVRDVVNGAATMRPLIVDNDGDLLDDTNTSVSTAGLWTFATSKLFVGSAAGTGLLNVNGAAGSDKGIIFNDAGAELARLAASSSALKLTGLGLQSRGTISETASTADEARLGVASGTPRLILEDNGQTQWEADNNAGLFRLFNPGSVRMSIDAGGSMILNPLSKQILPNAPYEGAIGSKLVKWLEGNFAELNVETIVAQSKIATIGGRVLVAPTTTLIEGITTASTTIKVAYNNLANGDRIYSESDGRVEFMAVSSGATRLNRCITNCDADTATSWSSTTSTVSYQRGERWQGDGAVQVSAASNADVVNTTSGAYDNNQAYALSVYVKRADSGAIVPSLTSYGMICDGQTVAGTSVTATSVGSGWYRLTSTCTSVNGTGTDTTGLRLLPNVIHYIDAMQAELGSTVTPWSEVSASYTVTRDLDGTGANAWDAGTAIVNTGTTGNGFIDIYSTRGVKAGTEIGPSLCGNIRLSTTYNDWAPRWCVGQLQGVYGYGSSTFGAAFGNPSATHILIDATNGIRIRNGSTTFFQADTTGGLYAGDPSGNRLEWDTANLLLKSNRLQIDENGITIAPSNTNDTDTLSAYAWGPLSNGGGVYLQTYEAIGSARTMTLRNLTTTGTANITISAANSSHSADGNAAIFVVGSTSAGSGRVQFLAPDSSGNPITVDFDHDSFGPGVSDGGLISLGTSGQTWDELFVSMTTTAGAVNPVGINGSGQLFERTNGFTGTTVVAGCTTTFQTGIMTGKAGAC